MCLPQTTNQDRMYQKQHDEWMARNRIPLYRRKVHQRS